MTDQIQVYPTGLIDLLNIKSSGGRALSEINREMRSVVETLDFFASASMVHDSVADGTMTTAGDQVDLTVPNLQVWLVYGAQFTGSVPAIGDALKISARLSRGDGTLFLKESASTVATVAGEVTGIGLQFGRPWVLTAGESLRMQISAVTLAAGNVIGVVRARFARLGPGSK